jgi:HEAT repeat protein
MSCAFALSQIGDETSQKTIINHFNDPNEPKTLYWWYACCLAEIDDETFRMSLIEQFNNSQVPEGFRLQYIEILSQNNMGREFLRAWLNHPQTSNIVKEACADALLTIEQHPKD